MKRSTIFFFLLSGTILRAEPVCENCATAAKPAPVGGMVKGPWIAPKDRKALFSAESIFEDHQGQKVSLHQPGKPLILSFIYTRCENERKCPRMTTHLAGLGREIASSGLKGQAEVVLMTYDPSFDQAKVLAEYGKKKQFFIDESKETCRLIRCRNENFRDLFRKWQLTVNFDNGGRVNIHGNQILVLDHQGRLARRYEILLPTHAQLIKDLETLTTEEGKQKE